MTNDTPAEHELPDDVNRWPSDPAAILGLSENASRRDLKRAYSRLIKRFKPEHAPEQFRRLREAFEQLDQQLEWREVFESHRSRQLDPDRADSHEDDSDRVALTESSTGTDGELNRSPPVVGLQGDGALARDVVGGESSGSQASSNETERLWQRALDGGDLNAVYSQLAELAVRRPPSEVGFARLYWLLTIRPELDSDRDPIAWLIDGMHKRGLHNRLLPMFSVEVRRRMGRVPQVLADDLYDESEAADRLVDVVLTRWFAARCHSRFDVIGADVQRLRTRLLDEPEEWQRLLYGAVRQLVLVRSQRAEALLAELREELAGLSANVASNWLWDALESTVALHEAWADGSKRLLTEAAIPVNDHLRTTLTELATLAEATWECSPLQARSEVIGVCVALTADVHASLHELTWIARVSRPLVRRLLELLQEQRSEFVDDDGQSITPAVEQELHRFVCGDLCQNLESADAMVLNFCLREAVTPHDIATVIEQHSDQLPDACLRLAESLRYHLPLHCLVEAQHVLW